MGKRLLRLNKVCSSYGKHNVLKDISFEIKEGEIIGLAGPNGAGKTTLLKLIVGLLKPRRGSIEILDTGSDDKNSRAISYLSQNVQRIDNPNFPATVKDIVSMGLYSKLGILGRLNSIDRSFIENAIKNVGLEKFKDSRITELSGGQLQKAFIARSLVSSPSILILDEPTTAVDVEGEEEFYTLIKQINSLYKVAVLLVSHDVYALLDHTNRLMFLNERLLYDGKPKDLGSSRLLNMLFYHKHSKSLVDALEKRIKKRATKTR